MSFLLVVASLLPAGRWPAIDLGRHRRTRDGCARRRRIRDASGCRRGSRFYRDEYKRTFEPDTIKLKTKIYKSEIGKNLDFSKIESLLISLTASVEHQDLFTQFDTTELKAMLTEKQIRKVAKWYDIDWQFKRRYSTKEQNIEFFDGCKSIDTLKTYVIERCDTTG